MESCILGVQGGLSLSRTGSVESLWLALGCVVTASDSKLRVVKSQGVLLRLAGSIALRTIANRIQTVA